MAIEKPNLKEEVTEVRNLLISVIFLERLRERQRDKQREREGERKRVKVREIGM